MSLPSSSCIIRDCRTLRDRFSSLGPEHAVVGLVNIKPTEELLFLDLVERGVTLFPSALAQCLARSKCLQASVLGEWMVPHTFVARDRHDLITWIPAYGKAGITRVVTKQNRFNCGLGVHVWEGIEEVHNQACFGSLAYPFVVQPLVESVLDIRVVMLGDYLEAYWRKNLHSFRNNLYFGGESGEYHLSSGQMDLCRAVLARGAFPYAHIDLMVLPDGATYLSEVNLRGGLKGARISTERYRELIARMEEDFIEDFLRNRAGSPLTHPFGSRG